MLNRFRHHDPIVLAFFPNRPDRRRVLWIADCPDSNPDRGRMLPGAGINGRPAGWAEEGLKRAACCGRPFKARRLTCDPDAIIRVVGEHAEWRPASALTVATVTSDDRRAWAGQIDCKLPALTLSIHRSLPRHQSYDAGRNVCNGNRTRPFPQSKTFGQRSLWQRNAFSLTGPADLPA